MKVGESWMIVGFFVILYSQSTLRGRDHIDEDDVIGS